MKEGDKSSFRAFEIFRGEEEKRLLNWFLVGDVLFLLATLVLENTSHLTILSWNNYWILFFSNLIFLIYVNFSLRRGFKISFLKYLFAIYPFLLIPAWIYFISPQYSRILLGPSIMLLSAVGFIFYDSRLLILSCATTAIALGFVFVHYANIGFPFQPYEIYLIYVFLILGGMVYYALIERTVIFLKELLEARSELDEAKTILEIKVRARTNELEELNESLDRRVRERTQELEEGRKSLLNILEDMAESKKETEEERNKTLAIITNFADGLLIFNKEKKLSLINHQAEKFLQISSSLAFGKNIAEMSKIPELKPLAKLLGKNIASIFREELKLREELILEVSVVLVEREEGNEHLAILHDITREKLVESMKTEFVSIAAHQLRTPLSVIKWTTKTLLDGDLGRISKEQRRFIDRTYQSNERMIGLINDLLNVARIEEGRYANKLDLSDITELVESFIKQYKDEIKKRKLKFQFIRPKPKLPKILIDAEKINLVIQNLLDNAMRYSTPGGVIKISLKVNDKKEIEFTIKDSGVGIPQAQQERIFTKFFRGSNVMKMDTGGSGLGLFIDKNIIDAHKGRIWFESKEGEGSTFYFALPISKQIE